MKKIIIFLVTVMLGFALMGCNGSDNADSSREDKKAETILNNWIQSVLNDFNYEKQFDVAVYKESDGRVVQSLLKQKLKKKILYSEDELILVHISRDTQQREYLALVLVDGDWKCTGNRQLSKIYEQQLCSNCSGVGKEVIGTHAEQGRYACAICGGSGWTSNTYYDGVLGWQTMQIGCSGCGGAGWLNGAHQVNDYGTCKECNGEGAFVIEGKLELEEEKDVDMGARWKEIDNLLEGIEGIEVIDGYSGESSDNPIENDQLEFAPLF